MEGTLMALHGIEKLYCNEIESLLSYNHAQNEAHT